MSLDLNAALHEIVAAAVDARIGEVTARADAMARLHGEYVKLKDAAKIMNVSASTVDRMRKSGRLVDSPVGISVRSIAALTEQEKQEATRRRRKPKTSAKFERIAP